MKNLVEVMCELQFACYTCPVYKALNFRVPRKQLCYFSEFSDDDKKKILEQYICQKYQKYLSEDLREVISREVIQELR